MDAGQPDERIGRELVHLADDAAELPVSRHDRRDREQPEIDALAAQGGIDQSDHRNGDHQGIEAVMAKPGRAVQQRTVERARHLEPSQF